MSFHPKETKCGYNNVNNKQKPWTGYPHYHAIVSLGYSKHIHLKPPCLASQSVWQRLDNVYKKYYKRYFPTQVFCVSPAILYYILQQPRLCIGCTNETYRIDWESHAKEPMTLKDLPEKPISGFL